MEEKLQEKLGGRLRAFRTAKGYSIEEIAHKASMNSAQLGKIERGERNFTMESLDRIVRALEISYKVLFDFDYDVKAAAPANPIIEKTVSCLHAMTVEEQKHIYKTAALLLEKEQKRK